jgi:signal transduction histidine kinase
MISEGSAFLDRSGEVLASDAGFRRLLGLPAHDAGGALRQRAGREPDLGRFLCGEGAESIHLAARDGAPSCELWRVPCDSGLLVSVAARATALEAPAMEYVMQALALERLAGSIAHEIKNPLNAMALQLALLGDKIGATSAELAKACTQNLASLKNQVLRIDEVVRRYLDVADPSSAASFDAASLLDDAATLFGHEARRRRVTLVRDVGGGGARAAGDPARAARLVLGLLSSALSATPDGGRIAARASCDAGEVLVVVEHSRGAVEPREAWMGEVLSLAAKDLRGGLERAEDEGTIRVALRLPKERPL